MVLIAFAFITHRAWFDPRAILTFGDWGYWPKEAMAQMSMASGVWLSFWQHGQVDVQLGFTVFTSVWAVLAKIGFSYSAVTWLTFLLPISIGGFLSPYYLATRITSNRFIGFCVALFYGSITYFLIRQTGHLPIAFVFAFAPLALNLLLIAIEKNRPKHWVTLAVFVSLLACYELRVTFIVVLVMALFMAVYCLPKIQFYWKNIAVFGILFVGLNVFWILPTILGGLQADVAAVANRGLFGSFLFDLPHAITISDASWTGSYPEINFIKQPVMLTSWIVPFLALLSPLIVKKSRRLLAILFLLIAIIGILLTKQSSPPWPSLYLWLYERAPGFNLFREASKFYLLTAIGYSGLLALGMEGVLARLRGRSKRIFMVFATVLFLALAAYNTKPLITGEIGTMFKPRTISNDYVVFEKYINKQDGFFRTLWVPRYSKWGALSIEHPVVSLAGANATSWSRYIGKDIAADQSKPQNVVAILKRNDAQAILASNSIKYVIIPIKDVQNDDNFFISYGNSRQYFIDEFKELKYLKQVDIGTKDLLVYKNEQYVSRMQSRSLTFKQIKPTKYLVSIKGIKSLTVLRFNEAYHVGWKLYGDHNLELRGQKIEHPLSTTTEVLDDYRFMQGEDINYLWREPVFSQKHKETESGLNEWVLDVSTIKKTLPRNSYRINRDGSIDVDLVVYFKPQSYFYLGLIISVLTLLSCIGYLIWDWQKRRKRLASQSHTPVNPDQQSTS